MKIQRIKPILLFLLFLPPMLLAQKAKVRMAGNETTIEEVFRQIEKQTDYTIAINHSELDVKAKAALPDSLITLKEALLIILRNTNCTFKAEGKHIIIYPKKPGAEEALPATEEPGIIDKGKPEPLPYKTIDLKEVVVTARNIEYYTDKNTYIVTARMREGASSAQEMLNKIHGIRFDRISNTIKVAGEGNVLLLVDGLQQSQEYIKNLSPSRIGKIEVINEPSGRYISEDYSAVINFILKKDFTGFDINVWNFNIFNPAGTNGSDAVVNAQPGTSLSYTKDKINLYGTFVYGRSRWNNPVSKEIHYKGLMDFVSGKASADNPNDHYKYNGSYSTAGVNYNINSNHIVSLQGEYTSVDERTGNVFDMDGTDQWSNRFRLSKTTSNRSKNDDYIASLFYKGTINEKLKLYTDLSYNYYSNTIRNEYGQKNPGSGSMSFNITGNFKESKKHTFFNAEGTYAFSPAISLNAGYSNAWREYISGGYIYATNSLEYKDLRNKAFAYLSFDISEKLKVKAGLAVENIHIDNKESEKDYRSLQPYAQLNYRPNKVLNIHAGYTTSNAYPSLYQLSPIPSAYDSIMYQTGNPGLKPEIRHTVSVKATLWDRLTISPIFKFTPDKISDMYIRDDSYYSTFANINTKQFELRAIYDQPLGKYFNLKTMFAFYHSKARHNGISNSLNGWLTDSELSYYNPRYALGIDFGYYRDMMKNILLQGYQMTDLNAWLLSASKQFLDKRLTLSLSYIPPISWEVGYNQLKKIDSPEYSETSNLNLRPYRNLILLRLSFRFNTGKVKQTTRESQIEREQRQKRSIEW